METQGGGLESTREHSPTLSTEDYRSALFDPATTHQLFPCHVKLMTRCLFCCHQPFNSIHVAYHQDMAANILDLTVIHSGHAFEDCRQVQDRLNAPILHLALTVHACCAESDVIDIKSGDLQGRNGWTPRHGCPTTGARCLISRRTPAIAFPYQPGCEYVSECSKVARTFKISSHQHLW